MSLVGQKVVLTRAVEQESELVGLLQAAGARVVQAPVVTISPLSGEALAPFDAAVRNISSYDAVLFTSANAVRFALERCQELGASLSGVTLFAIGPATEQALTRAKLTAHVAREAISEGVLATVLATMGDALTNKRFLFPRAKEGRDVLWRGLAERGAVVDVVSLYETLPLVDGPALPEAYDWLVFASPSAVRAFVQRFGVLAKGRVACMGPVTALAARAQGFRVDVVASPHTAAGLVSTLSLEAVQRQR